MISVESIEYYRPHWHDTQLEFAMVLEGSVDVSTGPDNYRMRKGNILLTGTETVHSFRKTNEDNVVLFIRIDSASWMNEFPGIMEWDLIADPAVEESHKEIFNRLRNYMVGAALIYRHSGVGKESRKGLRSLLEFCRNSFLLSGIMHEENITPVQIETFMKLNSFIKRNLRGCLTISEASEFINFSKSHTAFIVMQMAGMKFDDYLQYMRCLSAERMLVINEHTLSEISEKCGFQDLQDFDNSFKKYFRKGPDNFLADIEEDYPSTQIVNSKQLDVKSKAVTEMLKSFITSGKNEIIIDISDTQAGTNFTKPRFGIPDIQKNNDDISAIGDFITDIVEGKTKTVKQTDDKNTSVFNGDSGMVTHTGICKAVFYIYEFFSKMDRIIKKADGLLVLKADQTVRIVLYAQKPNAPETDPVRIIFKSLEKDFIIKRLTIDNRHGNPYYFWNRMDKPARLSPEQEKMIIKHSIPDLDILTGKVGHSLELDERIPKEGAVLIQVSAYDKPKS